MEKKKYEREGPGLSYLLLEHEQPGLVSAADEIGAVIGGGGLLSQEVAGDGPGEVSLSQPVQGILGHIRILDQS